MKLPRNASGRALARGLRALRYEVTHQHGSHIHLVAQQPARHHIIVPIIDHSKPAC